MKQTKLSNILSAFEDKPKTIGERLTILGFDQAELDGKFSKELLATSVYGSSFLKFFEDHGQTLLADDEPQESLTETNEETKTVVEFLLGLGIGAEDAAGIFSTDILSLVVTSDEFQKILLQNQDQVLKYVEEEATKGVLSGN